MFPKFQSARRARFAVIGPFLLPLISLLLLSGCKFSDRWDQEYACKGQERSTMHMQGHPESETYEKTYPTTIDFHIRSDFVLVKSNQMLAKRDPAPEQRMTFSSSNGTRWVSGSFDAKTSALNLIEGQTLVIDGTPQEGRTSGQYLCTMT